MSLECTRPDGLFKTTGKQNAIIPKNGVIYWHIDEKYITSDLEKYKVIIAFQKAFAEWQPYFHPVRFEATPNIKEAPIVIRFMKNGNKKLPSPFSGNTLAYAYFPNKRSLGIHSDMYFNDKYKWAEAHSRGDINLFKVVVHELGHAFGIDHNNIKKDIMFPTYQPNNEVNITKDTQDAIDYLYGKYKPKKVTNEGDTMENNPVTEIFNQELLKKLFGSVIRRVIDVTSGALLASTLPVLVSLGEWIQTEQLQIEAALISAIFVFASLAWSYTQKQKDLVRIKTLEKIK